MALSSFLVPISWCAKPGLESCSEFFSTLESDTPTFEVLLLVDFALYILTNSLSLKKCFHNAPLIVPRGTVPKIEWQTEAIFIL